MSSTNRNINLFLILFCIGFITYKFFTLPGKAIKSPPKPVYSEIPQSPLVQSSAPVPVASPSSEKLKSDNGTQSYEQLHKECLSGRISSCSEAAKRHSINGRKAESAIYSRIACLKNAGDEIDDCLLYGRVLSEAEMKEIVSLCNAKHVGACIAVAGNKLSLGQNQEAIRILNFACNNSDRANSCFYLGTLITTNEGEAFFSRCKAGDKKSCWIASGAMRYSSNRGDLVNYQKNLCRQSDIYSCLMLGELLRQAKSELGVTEVEKNKLGMDCINKKVPYSCAILAGAEKGAESLSFAKKACEFGMTQACKLVKDLEGFF